MDLMAHVITDVDADLEQNQPSGVKSLSMQVLLRSKYVSRVLLATYSYSFRLHRELIKISN